MKYAQRDAQYVRPKKRKADWKCPTSNCNNPRVDGGKCRQCRRVQARNPLAIAYVSVFGVQR